MEERIARLEGSYEQIRDRLNSIERTMDARFGELAGQMISRFDQIDARFGQIDGRFGEIDKRFMWLTGVVIGTWVTTILTILFHR